MVAVVHRKKHLADQLGHLLLQSTLWGTENTKITIGEIELNQQYDNKNLV